MPSADACTLLSIRKDGARSIHSRGSLGPEAEKQDELQLILKEMGPAGSHLRRCLKYYFLGPGLCFSPELFGTCCTNPHKLARKQAFTK